MADEKKSQDGAPTAAERKQAEAKLREAQDALAEAADRAAEAQAGMLAVVTRDVPDVEVQVLEGQIVEAAGQVYEEGDTLKVPGPTAIAMMQLGHVVIKGVA